MKSLIMFVDPSTAFVFFLVIGIVIGGLVAGVCVWFIMKKKQKKAFDEGYQTACEDYKQRLVDEGILFGDEEETE